MGLVPLGTSKNRESLTLLLDIAEEVDPLLVDVALDPQTSGGLLLAMPPDQARQLVQLLPASAVVGEVVTGPAVVQLH